VTIEIRDAERGDLDEHATLREQGYALDPRGRREWIESVQAASLAERMIGAYDNGRLVGRLSIMPFGQFFGGRPVPAGGIGAVVVAPEYRSRGLGTALLDAAVKRMRERGEVVSPLGPATMWVYRKCGWEIAGDQSVRVVPTVDLDRLSFGPYQERPATERDHDAIRKIYINAALARPGMLARPAWMWDEHLRPEPHRYVYVVEQQGRLDGYVIYRQIKDRGPSGYSLVLEDLAAATWEAESVLWRHLGAHQAQAREVRVQGLPLDALALHLPEQRIRVVWDHRWMLRIVDAPRAIAARGYPLGLTLSVPLSIDDARGPWHRGDWVLDVSDGHGRLVAGTGGGPAISINGLAALYSGFASARTLFAAGLLANATAEQIAALDAAFSGPRPAMNDDF
jgi:predicted acetyltransferase